MSKAPGRKRSAENVPTIDPIDAERLATLDRQLRAATTAFNSFDTAQERSDKALYTAIGRLAEFVSAVGNDVDSLITFAREKGVKVTKATSTATAVTKLVVTKDPKKANKYATVLQYALLKGIASEADAIAAFVAAEGGIEACLRAYRERPRDGAGRVGAGRPSAYSQAVFRVSAIASVAAPKDLSVATLEDGYFVVVGVRDADGTLRLIQKPVDDEKLIKAAVASIGKDA
jgi:hypothetical protein